MTEQAAPRPGRRPGQPDTRAAIVAAARAAFADHGYVGTSLRGVARQAGVDPALVHHYFADKGALFVAALELPLDPRAVHGAATGGDGAFGRRAVQGFLEHWDAAAGGPSSFVSVAQAMCESPRLADAVREFLAEHVWAHVEGPAGEPEERRAWRRAMVSSQLLGLAWARYILRVEPLASAAAGDVAAWAGPTLDRYTREDPGA